MFITCWLSLVPDKNHTVMILASMIGELEAVGNLTGLSTSSAIHLTWQAPFSLNITTAEPDVVYCVEIIVNTHYIDREDYSISNCSVLNTNYNFTAENPDPRDSFQFCVTPRSNVEGAKNGTPSVINITLLFESELLLKILHAAS